MAIQQRGPQHSVNSTTVADLLERVLDKGIVIAGDIKIKLVEVELLSIQIRLVICSVDKAKEIGIDWWNDSAEERFNLPNGSLADSLMKIEQRLASLEQRTILVNPDS